jgi:hypothetical protein
MRKETSILVFDIKYSLCCLERATPAKLTQEQTDWLIAETLERMFLLTIVGHNRKLHPDLINFIKHIESALFAETSIEELRQKREHPFQMKRAGSSIYLREVHA